MKGPLRFFITILIFVSCSRSNPFPEKRSESVEATHELNFEDTSNSDLQSLARFVYQYNSRIELFDLQTFEEEWQKFSEKKAEHLTNTKDIEVWIAITTELLELTQSERYAAELERIARQHPETSKAISAYVFTKNMDHIYVNLFQPKQISYTHSLAGEVEIKQETTYPKSGSVKLHFSMTERRYIELYIRIPDWAEGTTVTVKQVKYFAAPGSYCKIAKKWKEGDLVEVEFP